MKNEKTLKCKARESGISDTRVVLLERRRGVPVVPVDALCVEGIDITLTHPSAELVRALDKSDAEAPGCVPGDVAVPERKNGVSRKSFTTRVVGGQIK